MSKNETFLKVGAAVSIVFGAASGSYFTINPPSEQTVDLILNSFTGAIAGFVFFVFFGMMAVMILAAPKGGDGV